MFLKKLAMATMVMFFASSVIPELSITTEAHAVPGGAAAKKAAKAVAKAAKKAAKAAKKLAKKAAKAAKKVAKKAKKVAKTAAKQAKKVAKGASKVAGAAAPLALDAGMKVASGESPKDALTGAASSATGIDVTKIGKKKKGNDSDEDATGDGAAGGEEDEDANERPAKRNRTEVTVEED